MQYIGDGSLAGSSDASSLWLGTGLRKLSQLFAKFGGFLFQLVEQAFDIRPIKAGLRRTRAELVRFEQRRHCGRNSGQNRALLIGRHAGGRGASITRFRLLFQLFKLPFFDLDGFPVALDVSGGVGLHIPEDVRMAIDQLGGQPVQNIIDRERTLLLSHLGIEQDLKQQVAKFTGEFGPIAIVDRLEHLIRFLERVRLDGIEGLLTIPRATSGSAQALHDRDGSFKTFSGTGHSATNVNDGGYDKQRLWQHRICGFSGHGHRQPMNSVRHPKRGPFIPLIIQKQLSTTIHNEEEPENVY